MALRSATIAALCAVLSAGCEGSSQSDAPGGKGSGGGSEEVRKGPAGGNGRSQPSGTSVVGMIGGRDIGVSDMRHAATDLNVLREYLRLDRPGPSRDGTPFPPTGDCLLTLVALNETRGHAYPPLAYLLLQHEAQAGGVRLDDADVQAFLERIMPASQIKALREWVRANGQVTFGQIEDALKRWLAVHRAYTAAAGHPKPKDQEVRRLFRDLNEKVRLRVARIPARTFLGDVPPPTDGQVQEHFGRYRTCFPGDRSEANPFAFGYKQPNKLAVSYLLIRRDVLHRVCRPSEQQLMAYYRDHQEDFQRTAWTGAGNVAETFVKALLSGETKTAIAMVKPGALTHEHMAALADLAAVRKPRLLRAVQGPDGKTALAVTDLVRTAGGRMGSLLLRLVRAGESWHVAACDMKSPTAADQACADFTKQRKGAKSLARQQERVSFREAREDILATLSPEIVASRMDALSHAIAAGLARAAERGEGTGKDPYAWIVSRWTRPADDLLKRSVPAARAKALRAVRLERAIEALAEAAGVGAICYPWGDQGTLSIDPDLRVTIDVPAGGPLTLGQALAQIDAQVPALAGRGPTRRALSAQPRLKWVTCRGFQRGGRDVLFPMAGPQGLAMLPFRAGKTDLVSQDELTRHAVLGAASTSPTRQGGDTLVAAAFSVRELQTDKQHRHPARAEVGREGAPMYGFGYGPDLAGRLLWRVTQAVPAFSPKTPDDMPGLREKVIDDLKTKAAFRLAEKMGQELAASPDDQTFEDQAKARGWTTTETDLFPRKEHVPAREVFLACFRYTRRAALLARAVLDRPHTFPPSRRTGVKLADEAQGRDFIEKVFTLVPPAGATQPAGPSRKLAYSLPNDRSVVVVQRIAYSPPAESRYQEPDANKDGRVGLAKALRENQEWQFRTQWFAFDRIATRVGFTFDKDYADRGSGPAAESEEN